jgi:hypothetical protein
MVHLGERSHVPIATSTAEFSLNPKGRYNYEILEGLDQNVSAPAVEATVLKAH